MPRPLPTAQKQESFKQSTRLAFDGVIAENANEVADEIMGEIYELLSSQNKKRLQRIDSIGLQVLEDYKGEDKNSENRSQTGFSKLDEILKGMSAGNLIVLAARPKVGKTAFALSVAQNVAITSKTVAFYPMEMESSEIYERLLSKVIKIPMNILIERRASTGNLRPKLNQPQSFSARDLELIGKAVKKLSNLPLKINDKLNTSVNEIRTQCRRISSACTSHSNYVREKSLSHATEVNVRNVSGDPPLGLIVMDYLQLMHSVKKYDNRNLEVGGVCLDLKCLATEPRVSILCL